MKAAALTMAKDCWKGFWCTCKLTKPIKRELFLTLRAQKYLEMAQKLEFWGYLSRKLIVGKESNGTHWHPAVDDTGVEQEISMRA